MIENKRMLVLTDAGTVFDLNPYDYGKYNFITQKFDYNNSIFQSCLDITCGHDDCYDWVIYISEEELVFLQKLWNKSKKEYEKFIKLYDPYKYSNELDFWIAANGG